MGNDEDDELFDLFMLHESDKQSRKSSGGGCLGCLLLMISVPVLIVMGIATFI